MLPQLVFLSEPGCSAPELLKWTSLVVFHPPCAEDELKCDASCSHEKTCRMTAFVE